MVCKTCGLPEELCACSDIAKEIQTSIKVYVEKRKWGKNVTCVEGLNEKEIDLPRLAKKLKSKIATGGTAKDGKIELQGNHLYAVKDILIKEGFSEDQIDVDMASLRAVARRR
jgi:translation initiation factor 1